MAMPGALPHAPPAGSCFGGSGGCQGELLPPPSLSPPLPFAKAGGVHICIVSIQTMIGVIRSRSPAAEYIPV